MSEFPEGEGSYHAVYFIKEDLKREKETLLNELSNLSRTYWGGTDPVMDEYLKDLVARIEEITQILYRIDTGSYTL